MQPMQSLDELLKAINHHDPRLPWSPYGGLDLDEVPTFGGEPPNVMQGIVSWDPKRLLVRNGRDTEIVRRVQWGGQLTVLGDPYLGEDPAYAARWLRRIRLRMWIVGALQVLLVLGPAIILVNILPPLDGRTTLLGFSRWDTGYTVIKFGLGLLLPLSFFAGLGLAWRLEKALGVRQVGRSLY